MHYINSINELIFNTPLLRAHKLERVLNLKGRLFLKIEKFNLTGSIKDRAVYYMLNDAFKNKLIDKNSTLIEPTSGNTGISLCALCNYYDLKCIICMPENMSIERINLMKAYGAKVILTPKEKGMQGSIDKVNSLLKEIDNSYTLKQFENEYNVFSHYESTAKELFLSLDSKIDYIVAGIGTAGTIMGISNYCKANKYSTKIIGVEPSKSNVLNDGNKGAHNIQGIGAGFIPPLYKSIYVDSIIDVDDKDAFSYSKLLCKIEGLLVGISSGASLKAAIDIATKDSSLGKNIVCILPDGGEKYISMEEFINE